MKHVLIVAAFLVRWSVVFIDDHGTKYTLQRFKHFDTGDHLAMADFVFHRPPDWFECVEKDSDRHGQCKIADIKIVPVSNSPDTGEHGETR